ncbi:MAG: hypothetical protein N2486_05110 [Caloramator sp.]|nr:hypothetical protein [Caloramator sp.]
MEKFLENPNLPKGRVSLVVVDGRVPKEIERAFFELNIRIIKTERISTYDAIAYHPDIMLHHLGREKIVVAPNTSERVVYNLENEGFKIIVGKKEVKEKYPEGVYYNVATVGKFAVCNIKYTDEVLLEELYKEGVKIIDVKQGYSKCSISIVNENTIITSDKGIYKKVTKEGINCLLLKPGHVILEGLNYGFIGGATGLIEKGKLAFYGSLDYHPEGENIKNFLSKFNIKWQYLYEGPLLDFGTIVPLKEYCIMG